MKKNIMTKNLTQSIRRSLGRYLAIVLIIALGSALFVGLLMTKQDMVETGQVFTDEQNMFDLRLVSSYGWTEDQVEQVADFEGLSDVEGTVYQDALVHLNDSDEDQVFRFYTLTARLNQVDLRGGRMPQAPDECLADGFRADENILGTRVTLSESNEDDTLDAFTCGTYTVVGYVSTPLHMDMNRGSTTLGSGSLESYFYIPAEGLDLDYFTEIYVTIPGDHQVYTDGYNDTLDDWTAQLEPRVQAVADNWFDDMVAEAEEAYAEGYQEYLDGAAELEEGKVEAQRELADGYQKLADAEAEIIKGEKELADGEKQISDAWKTLAENEDQLTKGRKELAKAKADAYAQLDAAQAELDTNAAQVADGLAQLKDGLAQLDAGLVQVNDGIAQLEAALPQLESGIAQLEAMVNLLQTIQDLTAGGRFDLETLRQLDRLLKQMPELGDSMGQMIGSMLEDPTKIPEMIQSLRTMIGELDTTLAEYTAQLAELKAMHAEYAAQLDALYGTRNELTAQREELVKTLAELEAAQVQIDGGYAELSAARAQADREFAAAEAELADGARQLAAGKKTLTEKQRELEDGKRQLAEGRAELADGWAEYEKGKLEAEQSIAEAEAELADAAVQLADARQEIDELEAPETYVLDRNTNAGYASLDSNSDIVASISRVLPVFFLLIASLVCITTMTRMVDEERTQIGTMKALGYSNAAIISKYLIYSGSASVLGCGLGVLAGSVIFPGIIWDAYCIMLYIEPDIRITFDWGLCITVVTVYTGLMLLTTWYCCNSALKEVPAELIRPKAPTTGKKIFLEYLPFWERMGFLNKVALRNIFRYRQRLLMMLIGISGCTALLVTGFGLRDTISNVVDYQYEEITVYDMDVYFSEGQSTEQQAAIADSVADVTEDILFYHQESVDLDYGDRVKEISLIAAEDGISRFIEFRSAGELLEQPGRGEVLLSIGVAEAMGIGVGDSITLRNADMQALNLTVSGIYRNFVQNYAVVSPETIRDQWGEEPAMQMAFVKAAGQDMHRISARINQIDSVMNVAVSQETADMVGTMMEALDLIVVVIVFCAALLAVIVLYNLININVGERIREIATIKVLGFHAGETASYVFKENMVLSVVGAILGLGLGRIFLAFVISQVKIDMVWFQTRVSVQSFLLSLAMTLAATLIVQFIFTFKLEKINMAEALKSVE